MQNLGPGEGRQRVLLAQKRKGQVAEEASEPHGAEDVMEDIPDAGEEMNRHSWPLPQNESTSVAESISTRPLTPIGHS